MLSASEVSAMDDLARYLVLDVFLGFQINKTKLLDFESYLLSLNRQPEVIKEFLTDLNYDKVMKNLIVQVKPDVLTDLCKKKILEEQINSYLKVIDPTSGVKILECFKFKNNPEKRQIKVKANQKFLKGTKLSILPGITVKLSTKEMQKLEVEKTNYSVMYDSGQKCNVLLLGPISLVNHDCDSNSIYKRDKDSVVLKVKKEIKENQEITTFYGKSYFEINNKFCECKSCEKNGKGFFNKQVVNLAESQKENYLTEENLYRCTNFLNNVIAFKSLVHSINKKNKIVISSVQRRVNNQCIKGLRYDNVLYEKLVRALKNLNIVTKEEIFNLTVEQMELIIPLVYKHKHASSFQACDKFTKEYCDVIIKDIAALEEFKEVLAPECKRIESYTQKLVIFGIYTNYRNFAYCIYCGKRMLTRDKQAILLKLNEGVEPTAKDKSTLQNTLDKYKIYLQRKSEVVVKDVLRYIRQNNIKIEAPTVLIEKLPSPKIIRVLKKKENSNSPLGTSSRESSSFEFTIPHLSQEEINEIIGL